MKTKMWFFFGIFLTVAIFAVYFIGCNGSSTSEPEKSVNKQSDKNAIEKISDKENNRRRLLLEKFKKEVDESIKKIKTKWAKTKNIGIQGAVQLAPADQEAMDYANAITPSAYSYIYSAYGVDLNSYFSPGDPNIAIAGLVVSNLEADAQNGIFYELEDEPLYTLRFDNIVNSRTVASLHKTKKVTSKWMTCAVEATGLPLGIVFGVAGSSGTLSVRAVLKVVGKLARSALGWIGAAFALVQFSSCMDWI